MGSADVIKGSCLCGAVKVTLEIDEPEFGACHCQMCQKWGGGPALTVDGGRSASLKGEEFIATYASSEWAERGFCKRCGTHLFYRLKDATFCNFPLGLFGGIDHFKFKTQIFIESKPPCYEFKNDTKLMTGAEAIAEFSKRI